MAEQIATQLEPTVLVIFGITGDLSKRYLLPALYHLYKENLLNPDTEIIGVTRGDSTVHELFDEVELGEHGDNKVALDNMKDHTLMFKMNLDEPDGYAELLNKINSLEDQKGVCLNRLYYLSIPPSAYQSVINLLGKQDLNTSCQHDKASTRLLVEKPFGYDLNSAEELIKSTDQVFSEDQVFRIDHYMAKETVQNILSFRYQNPIFESLWNNKYIKSIDISAKEKIGIEGRAVFYEPLGALRDFIQNHLIQIMGIVTMDIPVTLDTGPIHTNKQAMLQQVIPVPEDKITERALRGQYEGYKEEVDNLDTTTETYADITVFIDNPRWSNVPIKLMTGKALDERKTEVCINFYGASNVPSNKLRFRIQPNEGIELDLITKKPGFDYNAQITPMDFSYRNDFVGSEHPNAYERVLVDAVRGDHTLFATSQEVLASWRIVEPVIKSWSTQSNDLKIYKPGSSNLGDETA